MIIFMEEIQKQYDLEYLNLFLWSVSTKESLNHYMYFNLNELKFQTKKLPECRNTNTNHILPRLFQGIIWYYDMDL